MLGLATIVCSVGFVAAVPDSIDVCDSSDFEYHLLIGAGTIGGTVQTNRCDEGVVTGNWWRGGGRVQFEFTVELDGPFPPCCQGYTASGDWDAQAGSGSYRWWNFGGQFCHGHGSAVVWLCGAPAAVEFRPRAEPGVPRGGP